MGERQQRQHSAQKKQLRSDAEPTTSSNRYVPAKNEFNNEGSLIGSAEGDYATVINNENTFVASTYVDPFIPCCVHPIRF